MQGRVIISNEIQECEWNKDIILAKRVYFSLHINLNDVVDNATIIELAAKREMKDANIEHTTNLTLQKGKS
jgi:hypothetical protein